MTFQELYENALRMIAESQSSGGDTSDYEERASYILATFCAECAETDRCYRIANGGGTSSKVSSSYVELSHPFPFSDVFASPAVYYLCAMLTLDENETMSERFFERYSDAIASIQASIPFSCEPIRDHYAMI